MKYLPVNSDFLISLFYKELTLTHTTEATRLRKQLKSLKGIKIHENEIKDSDYLVSDYNDMIEYVQEALGDKLDIGILYAGEEAADYYDAIFMIEDNSDILKKYIKN